MGAAAHLVRADAGTDEEFGLRDSILDRHEKNSWIDASPESSRSDETRAPAATATVYPIWRLNLRELSRPILVQIEYDDEGVVISSVNLRIWGLGSDKYEAREDFARAFEAVLTSYTDTPETDLTEGAKRFREILKSYVE